MRERGLEPRFFCGGGWYTDDDVRRAVAELGLVDCTPRGRACRAPGVLPTTHSLGALARAVLRPLPSYVHAYFHDYDLLDATRRRCARRALACWLGGGRRATRVRSQAEGPAERHPGLRHTIAALVATKPVVGTDPGERLRREPPAPPRLSVDIRSTRMLPTASQVTRARSAALLSIAALVVIDLAGARRIALSRARAARALLRRAADPLGPPVGCRGELAAVPDGRHRARLLARGPVRARASGARVRAASCRRSCSSR